MGVDRSENGLRAVLVPDPRLTVDAIVSKTHGTVPSSYTEAGPYAGPATPKQSGTDLVLRSSGTQGADGVLELITARSGGIGPDGAGYLFKDLSLSSSDYFGWDPYQLVTGWETLLWTAVSEGRRIRPSVIRLQSSRLLAAYSVTSLGVVRIKRYDPITSTWSDKNLAPAGAAATYITQAVALLQLPSGRVLAFCGSSDELQTDLYYSDDDGDTWAEGGFRVAPPDTITVGATLEELSASYSGGEVLLVQTIDDSGTRTSHTFASADLGTSFADVSDSGSEEPADVDVLASDGGGFLVTYRDGAGFGNEYYVRRFAYAGQQWSDAEKVTIETTTNYSAAAWRDEDGWLYALVFVTGSPGINLRKSSDDGLTWQDASEADKVIRISVTASTRLQSYGVASVGGRAAVVTRWEAPATSLDPNSVGVVWLGGHSNHTAPASETGSGDYLDDRIVCWGSGGGVSGESWIWLPIVEPDQTFLTRGAGSSGTLTLVSPGVAEIDTAAATEYYYHTLGSSSDEALFGEIAVDIDSGDGDDTTAQISAQFRLADSSNYRYTVSLRLDSSGFRVYDEEAPGIVGSPVSLNMTSRCHIRIVMNEGKVRTWYARAASHGHVRQWTEGPAGTIADGGSHIVSSQVQWGHRASGTATSRWHMVAYCFWLGRWAAGSTTDAAEGWTNPDDLHPRCYPSAGPTYVHNGVSVEATRGPAYRGQATGISTAYDYPVGAMLPAVSPSPRRSWRSTADNVATSIVWDLEADAGFSDSTWESSSLGLFLVGANLRRCKLQGWDGAAWQDIVVADASAGYSSLPFGRKGRVVLPNTGGAAPSGERWSFHMMHAGDSILLDDGETEALRRIASNAEGGWRSGTKLARLSLDTTKLTGSEPSSGDATIYRRNFGAVVHNYTAGYRYVRLHIPAQTTVDGYYEIGSLAIGPVLPFALQPGNGWSMERISNTELQTRESGVRSSRVRGPRRRAVDISWSTQAQDTTRAWGTEPTPDYVTGVAAGDPVASWADTAWQVLGLTERTDGSHSPVVYIGQLPRGAGSQTFTQDPTWLYGRITTEAPSIDHVVGEEGVSPVVRGNQIRIEEEV